MNAETKRHIDTARQVLVGVVPNPSSQIDQITNALIYKFMDDMDQSVIKIGGKPTFFTGDLEKYAWVRIMDSRIGSQERMNLYAEALIKFSQAEQLPQLFRDIFKLAFLPYRSPEVLNMFLREINYFSYSHSEDLGDAFEYLLSVMSSQGDAGMFRTPRHIIEFIVDVVNPTKDDKILDPACGTAGFLISAYKHVLEQHDGKEDPKKVEKSLTPEQKKALTNNFIGYDISPEMVRLSRVNMYLHNFKDPQIIAYNTLADEERWNDKFDVILANPPFMSPKGVGKPHSKFTIQASKSEVLFVDYIMNHLKPKGRAGIIVPEGIIFSSGVAYKQLRKNLVEDGLFAVVSLPSGVFNPYAGVKTSILLFNNEIAKQKTEILFVKVENDGFDLGATKRPISKNDLPIALEILNKWNIGEKVENRLAVYVEKTKIIESGDHNLSGDRYRIATDYTNAKWPMIELREVCKVLNGYAFKSNLFNSQREGVPIIRIRDVNSGFSETYYSGEYDEKYVISDGDLLIGMDGDFLATLWKHGKALLNQRVCRLQDFNGADKKYIHFLIQKELSTIQDATYAVTVKHLSSSQIEKIKIPLPPLEIQEQIVAELEGYAGIVAGGKQIAQNWKPKIDIDPEWEKVKLGDIASFSMGGTPAQDEINSANAKIPWVKGSDLVKGYIFSTDNFITVEGMKNSRARYYDAGTVLVGRTGQGKTRGTIALLKIKATTNETMISIFPVSDKLDSVYLYYCLGMRYAELRKIGGENERGGLTQRDLGDLLIMLPPLEIQEQIVEQIEAERALVESAKKLIEIYDQKIKETIAKLWAE